MFAQIAFAIIAFVVLEFFIRKVMAIRRNVFLGKKEAPIGNLSQRWNNVLLVAFGQKKMFARPIPAVLHFFIYAAFVITQIELLEIFVDGLTGSHRFFAPYLGVFYTFTISFIEILSVLALVATVVFLWRRNLLKLPRFTKSELNGWPRLDANLILLGELSLVFFIFLMNCADNGLRDLEPEAHHAYTNFAITGWLGPWLFESVTNPHILHFLERVGWWGHVLTVFGFMCYLPFSKHLHIIFAFPNTFYAKLGPKGKMDNMPEIQKEVASMLDPNAAFAAADPMAGIPKFGANDVFDLPWRTVLAAYSCTECGRCTSVCPANITGKKLSPRKIVMDVRDRADEIGHHLDANRTEFINKAEKSKTSTLTKDNYDDGRNLFSYISEEEIRACTTCNACVEACPVLIDPLEMIIELRRNLILEQSKSPDSWNAMFNSLENNSAPWAFSPSDRDKWMVEN